ncbi:MAG: citramalate synthase [Actinomycetota bacterium]|nr:citramalate synthase [Actinomycetota bacterium]
MAPAPAVDLYDTTLRDGTQREGISLTVPDKLRVATLIDALGVGYIEGGWPGANPKDTEFFRRATAGDLQLRRATLTAFGMTRRPRTDAASDPTLAGLLTAATPVVCVVGKSCSLHVTAALGTTGEENLAMVADSIRLLRREGRRVFFDAEHFFDGHARDEAYALQVAVVAAEAGAECVVLCDTNGGALPDRIDRVVRQVVGLIADRTQVGVHVHNDTDCAVANSLVAVRAGATHVQGTVNGIGERCGNANLVSIIANLKLKLGVEVIGDDDLRRLTHVAHAVAEVMNLSPDPHAAYVGHAAFAHKAGLHVSALAKRTDLYQHVEPDTVGNSLRLLMSELAGRSTVVLKGKELGIDLSGDAVTRILERVKQLEHAGYVFEAADASLELLVRSETGQSSTFFRLESFRTIVERDDEGRVLAEATVKVWVGEERLIGVAEGNGPVDALDRAFRAAVAGRYPELARLHLADYKVRILDPGSGTGATTRVLVTSADGEREWETVGVSSNIIDASWRAMQDAYDYGLLHAGARGLAPTSAMTVAVPPSSEAV